MKGDKPGGGQLIRLLLPAPPPTHTHKLQYSELYFFFYMIATQAYTPPSGSVGWSFNLEILSTSFS